ncbi:hypothetical protein D7D52_32480 [Nocardia yunnanensis]|uniref:Uncharacterized protein n=1 Tax=Nocardia yunnanensis TaxID=2382165 RepID=A0A386ZKB3_9NOCA|nr:hypothetical protein [Nocardia yunnanensis]AYF77750.1 hypothetical protein D7D52_32480 [Nocardia yunnanensis]
MTGGGWVTFGWVMVFVLPSAVGLAAIFWPERIPKDRTVQAIQRRIEDEDDPPPLAWSLRLRHERPV